MTVFNAFQWGRQKPETGVIGREYGGPRGGRGDAGPYPPPYFSAPLSKSKCEYSMFNWADFIFNQS